MAGAGQLHLPDLTIRGFRGIDELSISRLGRVTLLAGRNGVGKTTVLDAVRVYASRGQYSVLHELLHGREEMATGFDDEGVRVIEPDWSALFYGWEISDESCVGVGSTVEQIEITRTVLSDAQEEHWAGIIPPRLEDGHVKVLRISFAGSEWVIPSFVDFGGAGGVARAGQYYRRNMRQYVSHEDGREPEIVCESLGPGPLANEGIARFWDAVALTDDEYQAVSALKLVLGEDVDRIAVIGDGGHRVRRGGERRVVVKLGGHDRPVPLKSVGDGALRLFGVALALANSRDGFLLMDEAENGIHHSVQRDLWRMVIQTAQENNVQVLATTHSWDCVRGFAQAATEIGEAEGVLVRLDRDDYGLRAVEYSEEDLEVVVEQGIEVR